MYGSRRDGDRARADLGVGTYFLGYGERVLEQSSEVAAQRIGLLGVAKRVLQLPENLRLAEHHRIESAGHTEYMADRFVFIVEREEGFFELSRPAS